MSENIQKMEKIEAVLFDLDGTLVDFINTDSKIMQIILNATGSQISFENFLQTSIDVVMDFHRLVAEQKVDPLVVNEYRLKRTFEKFDLEWKDEYLALYRKSLVDECVPYAGVERMLIDLAPKAKTGLITNAYDAVEQRKRICHAGLHVFFDVIVVAGEVGIRKPDPAIFFLTLEKMGVAPENSLYIGDSIAHDIEGARAAGIKSVLIADEKKPEAQLADYCVQGICELRELLSSLI